MSTTYKPTATYTVIYIFTIHDESHEGKLKVGKASLNSFKSIAQLLPNSPEIQKASHDRIKEYTRTAMVEYDLLHCELAVRNLTLEDGSIQVGAFTDDDIHDVLKNSGYCPEVHRDSGRDAEWFKLDISVVHRAIKAFKNGLSIIPSDESEPVESVHRTITLREEQAGCVEKTRNILMDNDEMLWDCKMRFGKTVTSYEFIRQGGYKNTIVITHRPAVKDGWLTDHDLIFRGTNHRVRDKSNESLDGYDNVMDSKNDKILSDMVSQNIPFVYFASIQDLRGSQRVGGKYNKNNGVYDLDWDLIIVDEAHEGIKGAEGEKVIEALKKEHTKVIYLTGTAYELRKYFGNNIFTWTYVDEQYKKRHWDEDHPGERNPYADLPTMNILTFDVSEKVKDAYRFATANMAFTFHEFFRTWTGDIDKDFYPIPAGKEVGDFVWEDSVDSFLTLISKDDDTTNYPFSTEEYREMFAHTFWIVPGVKEAAALSKMLNSHPNFHGRGYKVVNIAGEGDVEKPYDSALENVKAAIKQNEKTITLSCGRLTTGVTVPEWTGIMMLSGSADTSATGYMQAIFRVQSPAVIKGKRKENCYVFDFAPDRALKVITESIEKEKGLNKKRTPKQEEQFRVQLTEFINFCPVIAVDGTEMRTYDVPEMMRQIKRITVDAAINSGFDDNSVYLTDAGITRSEADRDILRRLSDVVAPKKKGQRDNSVLINKQGLTEEEHRRAERAQTKQRKGKELTPEEQAVLEKYKEAKKEQQKLFDLLRAVSIRLPLLFYGADADITEIIKLEDFVRIVDDESWEEFMPKGLRKDLFIDILRFYDEDVVVGAGLRIRKLAKAADEYPPTIRAAKIVEIISTFKNPDKETVLTPWRVVNMHLGNTLGGYNFYDENFIKQLEEPRFIEKSATADILLNNDVKILELNSKSGLYPLYMTYSLYMFKLTGSETDKSPEALQGLWNEVLKNNIFVLCKTKMAQSITMRTLVGYTGAKVNTIYLPHLIERMRDDMDRLKNKLTYPATWGLTLNEGERMKFDAVIGNPPYNETIGDEGNDSLSKQLFPYFVMCGIKTCADYCSLITPSRWFTGDAQDKSFLKLREFIRENNHFSVFYNYHDAKDIFNNVLVTGGVSYWLYKKDYTGQVEFHNNANNKTTIVNRDLFEEGIDVIISSTENHSIVQKIRNNNFVSLTTITKGRNAFGITGSNANSVSQKEYFDGAYELRCAYEEIRYVEKDKITKNIEMADKWKVFISKGNGGAGTLGDNKVVAILGKPYLGKPHSVCTDSLIPIGCFDTEKEAVALQNYIKTKFLRYVVGILKVSQNVYQNVYQFVPLQNFTESSDIDWSKPVSEIDQQLYAKYALSTDEIAFIESMIKPME